MVIRLKGKNGNLSGKAENSEWLGSRDSNPDSMIQSHVSVQKVNFSIYVTVVSQIRLTYAETMVLGLKGKH